LKGSWWPQNKLSAWRSWRFSLFSP